MDRGKFKVRLDFIYSLCLIAGPLQLGELSPSLLSWAQDACRKHAGSPALLSLSHEGFGVRSQLRLRELRARLERTPSLYETLNQIEHARQQHPSVHGSRELRARARQALVEGDDLRFEAIFLAYGHADQIGWHPDRNHQLFWYDVLGAQLLDGDLIRHDAARAELAYLIMRTQALGRLSQPPPLDIIPEAAEPPSRRGRKPRLPQGANHAESMGDSLALHAQVSNLAILYSRRAEIASLYALATRFPDVPIASACAQMLHGDCRSAHHGFSTSFTHSEMGAQLIQHQQIEAALPLGILNAIIRQARASVIQKWLHFASICLLATQQQGLNPALQLEHEATLQLLEQLDLLLNRDAQAQSLRERLEQLIYALQQRTITPPALLLLLLTIISEQLPQPLTLGAWSHTELLASRQQLIKHQHSDPLYTHYLACYLLSCEQPYSHDEMQLLQSLVHPDIAALHLKPRSARLHSAELPSKEDIEERKQLYWDVHLDSDGCHITQVVPRLLDASEEAQRRGRPLSLEKLRRGDYDHLVSSADQSLLPHIKRNFESTTAAWQLDYKGFSALAQHPRLRLLRPDSPSVPLRLHAQHAGLQVRVLPDGLIVHLPTEQDYRQLHPLPDGSYHILHCTPRLEQLQQILGIPPLDGNYKIERETHPQLCERISQLAGAGQKQPSAPAPAVPTAPVPEQITPLVHLSYRADSLQLTLGLRIHPDSPAYFETADEHAEIIRPHAQSPSLTIIRSKADEELILYQLMEHCPSLHSLRSLPSHAPRHGLITGLQTSLQCLLELQHCQRELFPELELLWQGSEPLQLIESQSDSLHLQLKQRSRLHDWFALGGQLVVDELRIYQLQELLERQPEMLGRFLPLGGGHYVALHEGAREQLAFLHGTLTLRGERLVIPRAALLPLSAHWHPESLSPELHKLISQLQQQLPQGWYPPPTLHAQLRDYQLLGVRWLIARAQQRLGCCLADDMGLGKTVQILTLLLEQAHAGPSLVIAPLSLLRNWASEAERFAPSLRVYLHQPRLGEIPALQAGDLYLVSYGQLLSTPELALIEWNGAILDEAQAIKNPRSQRSRAAGKLRAHFRIAVTGTPVENHLSDLWSLMHFLNPGLLGKYPQYLRDIQRPEQLERIKSLIAPLILRRHKSEVLLELPPLTELTLLVDLSPEERVVYESHRRLALEKLEDTSSSSAIHALAELTKLRRICCHAGLVSPQSPHSAKLDLLTRLLAELQDAGHRVLIFSQFTDVLQLAQQRIEQHLSIQALYLDGSTPAEHRAELIARFQAEEQQQHPFFFISLKAGGSGLNLTNADYVILLDPWWNPAIEAQAAARAHRMGQAHPVTLYRLICRDSVEEHILKLHQQKRELSDQIDHLSREALLQLLTAEQA